MAGQWLRVEVRAGSASGCAASLKFGPSNLSSLLLASFGLLSGREHCLHCPLVGERGKSKSCLLMFLVCKCVHIFVCMCEPERLWESRLIPATPLEPPEEWGEW